MPEIAPIRWVKIDPRVLAPIISTLFGAFAGGRT
jgi:hypothetical protein